VDTPEPRRVPPATRWPVEPLAAFFLTRLGVAAVAYFAAPIVVDSSVPPYHMRPGNTLLDVFGSRWDNGFYLAIAADGYSYRAGEMSSVAFFPLFPLAIRAVSLLTGDPLVAGILISNLALLGAALVLHRLVALGDEATTADRTVWYLLIYPASFFGSAIYSESLFLLTAISALYMARRGRWGVAGAAAYLAGLTRLTGLLLAPVLCVEWLSQRRANDSRSPPRWGLLAPLGALLGTATFMVFLQVKFGDPLAFAHAAAAWQRTPTSLSATAARLFMRPDGGWGPALLAGRLPLDDWFDLGAALLFVCLGVGLLARRRWSEAVFVLLGAVAALGSGLLMSQRRYMWSLFPAFLQLAEIGNRVWVDRAVWVFSLLGLGLFTALYANWYWVG